jgi:hypothetical protein
MESPQESQGNRPADEPAAEPAQQSQDQAVVDLLGVLAYGELSGFEQLAADATRAPDLRDKAQIAELAAAELRHFALLRTRLESMGVDVTVAMAPFVDALELFHASTRPVDWLEGVVKAYVGNGIAVDFYREVSGLVDDSTRALVLQVLGDTGQADFAVERVCRAIEEDPVVAGRLALWGRRIVGEALAQAQQVVARRPALADLMMGNATSSPGFDLAGVGQMFTRITQQHTQRMAALGLAA